MRSSFSRTSRAMPGSITDACPSRLYPPIGIFEVEVGVERELPALAPPAGLLEPAEWNVRRRRADVVDADDSAVQLAHHAERTPRTGRVDIAGQTERPDVGQLDRFIVFAERP